MLNDLKFIWGKLKKRLRGFGACMKCACMNFTQSGAEIDLCECGHSYADHY